MHSYLVHFTCNDKVIFFPTMCNTTSIRFGEQGWPSGESARLPPMWPGFNSRRRRHVWVEFVVGSLPYSERFFSGYSGFPLSSKTNTSKFHFDLDRTDTFKRIHMNSYVLRGWTSNFHFFLCKIRNNQGLGIGYQLRPSARQIILDITKTSSINVLVIVINTLFELQMDKYPLLRDQVEKIVVQHGRKGEAKSKDQVLDGVICSGVFFILFAWTWDAQSVVVGSIFKSDVFMFQFKAHNEIPFSFFLI